MAESQTITVRLSEDAYLAAHGAADPLLGINTCIAALVRDIVSGRLARPAPPAGYGNLMGKRLGVRIRPEVWVDPASGDVPEEYTTSTQRSDLVRDLAYAIGEGRVSIQIVCLRKEVNGDSHA